MNKIHLKRLKRKRILEGHKRCHGNVFSCFHIGEHLAHKRRSNYALKIEKPIMKKLSTLEKGNESFFLPEVKKAKTGFFRRIFS